MTRRGLGAAMAVAVVASGLLAGTASAAPLMLGNLDQDVGQQDAWVTVDQWNPVTQSFTAGATGRLVYVELYCAGSSQDTLVSIGVVSSVGLPTWWCSTTPGWVAFPFYDAPLVQSGAQYTMTIRDEDASSSLLLAVSASDYAGGCLGSGGTCMGDPTDIAFRTYVQPFPSASLAWSPTSLTPGTSTPVTLTLQADFPGYVVPVGVPGNDYLAGITIDPLPAWFTPTGVTCSAAIDPTPCAQYLVPSWPGAWSWDLATDGSPFSVTVVVSGTATLPAGGGSASASGCAAYPYYFSPYIDCTPAQADLAATGSAPTQPAGTPPPTGTAPEGGSSGGQLPWLLWALWAALASLLVLGREGSPARKRG